MSAIAFVDLGLIAVAVAEPAGVPSHFLVMAFSGLLARCSVGFSSGSRPTPTRETTFLNISIWAKGGSSGRQPGTRQPGLDGRKRWARSRAVVAPG